MSDLNSMELDLSWENSFANDERVKDVKVSSPADALVMSVRTLGRVDIEYIAQVTGLTCRDVIKALSGSIYQNPLTWNEVFYKGWEMADEYLSGNVLAKWREARKANDTYHGYFKKNVKALEAVLPEPLKTDEIYVTLGSPWGPTDVIEDFIIHIMGENKNAFKFCEGRYYNFPCMVTHDQMTGSWDIANKCAFSGYASSSYSFGTTEIPALHMLERTLNMKSIVVYAESAEEAKLAGHPRQINKESTAHALAVQQKMIKEFQSWVWQDEKRADRLLVIYEETYGGRRARHFDGSFLDFPEMNPKITLYPYQKNAVARIIFTPNTLLAHDVGSGKTYVMIAAGMELKRMGLSKKNLYVVPNNILGQWEAIFKDLYPNAKLLTIGPRQFTPKKRKAALEDIRHKKYDAIIMAYSCFDQIEVSQETDKKALEETLKQINAALASRDSNTKQLQAKKKLLQKKLEKLKTEPEKQSDLPTLEKLGITRLFLDEAHNYKNVTVETKADKVLGLTVKGSAKSDAMMCKVKLIQKQNDGGGVVFATGTPITNSLTEVFTFQHYLQSGMLSLMDIANFDSWIGMFAERVTQFEVDVDTSNFRLATRFAKFHNLPELTAMLSEVADFHRVDGSEKELPEFDGYTDRLIEKTSVFERFLKKISERADMIRHGRINRHEDNMLLLTTDGRKAALDMRLVDEKQPKTPECKSYRLAENVYQVYQDTADIKGTQLIFCDYSTPKADFNLYDEVCRYLVGMGIPRAEIAYIHDAVSDLDRELLFEDVRQGNIRVLIGSTFKLGLGVNVQERLAAIHHLDVPWRPADMVQREGRILRQGNMNKKISIFRYITKGSFDAYSWQLLETKQRFISDILSGSLEEHSGSDVDDTVLDYAEVKALAVGNDLIKQRVEIANEIQKQHILFHKYEENRERMEAELAKIPIKIARLRQLARTWLLEEQYVHPQKNTSLMTTAEHKEWTEKRKSLAEKIHNEMSKTKEEDTSDRKKIYKIAEYRGFDVIIPKHIDWKEPYIILKVHPINVEDDSSAYEHIVKLGDSTEGYIRRMDYYLDHLNEQIDKLYHKISEMNKRKEQIDKELAQPVGYQDEIERLTKNLASIDKALGVEKDEQ